MTKGQRAGESAIAVDVEQGKSYYWCSCGKSSKQPFCDGSHKGTDFNPVAYKAEEMESINTLLALCSATLLISVKASFCSSI